MKTKLLVIVSLIFMLSGVQLLNAQEVKTVKIKVLGNCDACKVRIEKAANSVAGVQNAAWSIDSNMLDVTFDQSKTSSDAIQKAIANVGYDTEKYKADNKTYNALPACCQYERSK